MFAFVIKSTHQIWIFSKITTVWKLSKYGIFSGSYLPAFGLNMERYGVSRHIQSECGKIRTSKNSVFWHCSPSVSLKQEDYLRKIILLSGRKTSRLYLCFITKDWTKNFWTLFELPNEGIWIKFAEAVTQSSVKKVKTHFWWSNALFYTTTLNRLFYLFYTYVYLMDK